MEVFFILSIRNTTIVLISVIFIMIVFTSCKYALMIDLIHKDTVGIQIGNSEEFLSGKFEQYQINGVLFLPYTIQKPFTSYEDKYYNYALGLVAYKQNSNERVIINHVTIDGYKNVRLSRITKDLSKELEFSYDEDNGIQMSEIILIDEINDYNMELTDKSQIKVVLNITVEENGKNITRDLEYIFETKIRKYLVQR